MPRSDFASLEVDGQRLDAWLSYSIDSDMLTPADGFRMEVAAKGTKAQRDELRRFLRPGRRVKLYIGRDVTGANPQRALQMTGIIDERLTDAERGRGSTIEIEGRDLAALLVKDCVPIDILKTGTTFIELARTVCEPFSIPVVADASASRDILTGARIATREERLAQREARAHGISASVWSRMLRRQAEREGRPADEIVGVTPSPRAGRGTANRMAPGDIERQRIKEAKPRAGETRWEFLARHAEHLSLMMWFSPDGKLIIGSPRYDTPPLYRFVRRIRNRPDDPNTILEGSERANDGDRYSAVKVYGKTRETDGARAKVVATAIDPDWDSEFEQTLVIHDNEIRTGEEALKRAERELAMHKANAQVLNYVVNDHGQGEYLYAPDTMADVDDEVAGVYGRFWVCKRTFTKDRKSGTRTALRLMPPNAIVL